MLTPERARIAAEEHIVKYCNEMPCITKEDAVNALITMISSAPRAIEKYSSNHRALSALENVKKHIDANLCRSGDVVAPKVECKATHEWDHGIGEGDTCVKCGDKDHVASQYCSEGKLDNSYHWHYLTFSVECTDGTKSVCEIPLASSAKRVRYVDIEECRKLAISMTPLSDYAAIQSVCYLGLMTEIEFSSSNDLSEVMAGS